MLAVVICKNWTPQMPLLESFKNLSYQEKVLYGAASIIALMLIFLPTVGSDFMRGLRAGFGGAPDPAPAQAVPPPALIRR
jgi:hypothetical protein